MRTKFLLLLTIFLLFTPFLAWAEGDPTHLLPAELAKFLPDTQVSTWEGKVGKQEARINFYRKGPKFFAQFFHVRGGVPGAPEGYDLEKVVVTPQGILQLDFWVTWEDSGDGYHFEGKLEADGNYSGKYSENYSCCEAPSSEKGQFTFKPGTPDLLSGKYYSPVGELRIYQEATGFRFEVEPNYSSDSIRGETSWSGRQARFEEVLSGVQFFIHFDLSQGGACRMETNIDSPEAKEQHLPERFACGGINENPTFAGTYQQESLSDLFAGIHKGNITRVYEEKAKANEKECLCTGLSDADKSRRLDGTAAVTYQGPGPDLFVFHGHSYEFPSSCNDSYCGLRVDIFKRKADGSLTRTGRWENLNADYYSSGQVQPAGEHCLFSYDRDKKAGGEGYPTLILDEKGKVTVGGDPCKGGAWVAGKKDDLLWCVDFNGKSALVTPDLKPVWSKTLPPSCGGFGYGFSPTAHYLFYVLKGRVGVHILGADGHYSHRIITPFLTMKGMSDEPEILGLTDEPALMVARGHFSANDKRGFVIREVHRIGVDGKGRKVAVFPTLPDREGPCHLQQRDDDRKPIVYFEYAATTERIKDFPRPILRFDYETMETQESLDGEKTWKSVDIEVK